MQSSPNRVQSKTKICAKAQRKVSQDDDSSSRCHSCHVTVRTYMSSNVTKGPFIQFSSRFWGSSLDGPAHTAGVRQARKLKWQRNYLVMPFPNSDLPPVLDDEIKRRNAL